MKKLLGFILILLINAGSFAQQASLQCKPADPALHAEAKCTSVDLSWSHDGKYLEHFQLYRNGELLITLDGSLRDWTDKNVKEGKTYVYGLQAFGPYGESAAIEVSVSIPYCLDCDSVRPITFEAYALQYFDAEKGTNRYFVRLEWESEGNGKGGEWELLKVAYKILPGQWLPYDPQIGLYWIHPFKVIPTPYFDGRVPYHFFDDYAISKHTDVTYLLRWRCGFCSAWVYYGPKHLVIPEK